MKPKQDILILEKDENILKNIEPYKNEKLTLDE